MGQGWGLWRRHCPPQSQRLRDTLTEGETQESDRDREIGQEADRCWQSLGDRERVGHRHEGAMTKIHTEAETERQQQ